MLNHDFSDVTPSEMDPDNRKNELVPISYDPAYSSLMSIFRPLCIAREYSLRVLKLTSEILDYNPSHYSVWKYRLDTLKHLDKLDLWKDEIEFLNQIGAENPKSYQIWHHRQVVVEKVGDSQVEREFVSHMLENDSKNYHCWQYKQWLVNNFGTWAEEEQECVKLIDQDCRNNSAWNQLYFCVNHRVMEDLDAADDIVAKQVEYTIEQLMLESDNECPFNYIRGLLQLSQKSIADYPNLMRTLNGLAEKNNRFSLAMLMMHSKTDVLKYRQYAGRLLEVDPIRENYWKYMLNSI